jgi:hypothetical protein
MGSRRRIDTFTPQDWRFRFTTMPSIPLHDFHRSIEAARLDTELKSQLRTYLNSDALAVPQSDELVEYSCCLVNLALGEARELYARNPERLVCVIAASAIPNAFAIWGSTRYDWVVLTEGILLILRDSAEKAAARIAERFPEILQSSLGKRVISELPLSGGFQSGVSSLLYVAAIGFFVGHEAGHHLGGHDGYFRKGAQPAVTNEPRPEAGSEVSTDQALEFQADRDGALISHLTLGRFLWERADFREWRDRERRLYERIKAVLISAGAFIALVIFRPRVIDWTYTEKSTHPPAVLRAIAISDVLSATFKKLGHLTEAERRWIRIITLELAAQGAIAPKSEEEKVFQQRGNRAEPAALRALGIRAALYDRQVAAYIQRIEQRLEVVQARLLPRRKPT